MRLHITVGFILTTSFVFSQSQLQPVFDAKEYAELLSLAFYSSSIPDSAARAKTTDPYKMEYRSPEVGLLNRWTLYLRNDNVAIIDLRGTINQASSWLANFYAAMIPATGSLQLNDSTKFEYKFAEDPKAAVHVGWTVALGHLAPDIEQKINYYYSQKQVKQFLIFGHSQGAALAFLLRSYLEYEKQKGKIPNDVLFKTYCSAAPKPGNMYYVYDFDFINRGGWQYTIVNGADWVPESPFSIQTLQGFNPTNPLRHTKTILRKQKLLIRFVGGMVYGKLERKPRKAQRKFEKYLGRKVYKLAIKKALPQLKEPQYVHDNNYMRAGTPVILMPDDDYRTKFPESNTNNFVHHMFKPYYYLLNKYYRIK
jgi:hypothetical protein